MGQYPITAGVFGKAMRAVGKTGTPDGKPAWVFENQTGDLGTLLNSSLIWCGDSGSIDIIPAGTSLSSVSSLSLTFGGAAYTDVTADTTCSNTMFFGTLEEKNYGACTVGCYLCFGIYLDTKRAILWRF